MQSEAIAPIFMNQDYNLLLRHDCTFHDAALRRLMPKRAKI